MADSRSATISNLMRQHGLESLTERWLEVVAVKARLLGLAEIASWGVSRSVGRRVLSPIHCRSLAASEARLSCKEPAAFLSEVTQGAASDT